MRRRLWVYLYLCASLSLVGSVHLRAAAAGPVPFAPVESVGISLAGARALDLVDLDRDGDLDVIAVGAGSAPGTGDLFWFQLGPSGSWTTTAILSGIDQPTGVATGDLDGDGDLDLAVAITGSSRLLWVEDTGGTSVAWSTHLITITADGVTSPVLADFDRDGDLDLAVAETDDDRIVVWNNDGSGTFTSSVVSSTVDAPVQLQAVDLDRDADLDLLAAVQGDGEIVWFENELGAWSPRVVLAADEAMAAVAGDVDGDGDVDVIASEGPGGSLIQALSTGSVWTISTLSGTRGSTTGGQDRLLLHDMDLDGDLDLAAASSAHQELAWWERTTSGWQRHEQASGQDYTDVAAADLDQDGDIDLFATASSIDAVGWFENRNLHATSVFEPRTEFDFDIALSPGVADLDADGDDDVFGVRAGDPLTISWWENTLAEGTAPPVRLVFNDSAPTHTLVRVAAFDQDDDGDIDLIGADTEAMYWWENAVPTQVGWPTDSSLISSTTHGGIPSGKYRFADLHGNGFVDMLTGAVFSTTSGFLLSARAFYGFGTSELVDGDDAPVGSHLALGDFDADGDPDAALALDDGSLQWYENFSPSINAFYDASADERRPHSIANGLSGRPLGLESADLDRDGNPDLLTASADEIAWFRLLPSGASFEIPVGDFGGTPSEPADLDIDGDLDFVVTDALAGELLVLSQAGIGGAFEREVLLSPGFAHGPDVVLADLDRDGDLDLLTDWMPADSVEGFGWWENRRVQLLASVFDEVASPILTLDPTPVLRLEVQHAGRSGDDHAALSRLAVRIESEAGSLLPGTEVLELFGRVGLYQDDGDRVFDPGDTELWIRQAPNTNPIEIEIDPSVASHAIEFDETASFWLVLNNALGQPSVDRVQVSIQDAEFEHGDFATSLSVLLQEQAVTSALWPSLIFTDDFELGSTEAWSTAVP